MHLTRRAQSITPSATLELSAKVSALRAAGVGVIGLTAGEPDFPSPPEAIEAARKSLEDGHVRYLPTEGLPALREAAAALISRVSGASFDAAQVLVTCGAKEGLALAILALAEAGDEVIVPTPAWISYEPMITMANARLVTVPCGADAHFKLRPEGLARALGPASRVLLLNSPANPTGSVYSQAELAALAEVLADHPAVTVLSDEIYWPFVYEGRFASPASVPALAGRTIVVNGVSKSHAMTGWRIGFLAAPPEAAAAIGNMKSHMTSNASAPAQHAALAALEAGDGWSERMAQAFARRRGLVLDALAGTPGLELVPPAGAFYAFARADAMYSAEIDGSLALCRAMLEEVQLALVPGAPFGDDDYVRLSFATSDERLQDGLSRLNDYATRRSAALAT